MTATPPPPSLALMAALRPVQARLHAQAWAVQTRAALTVTGGAALLGGLLHALWPGPVAGLNPAGVVGAALLAGVARLAWHAPARPTLPDAAQVADRRAGLSGLLGAALGSQPTPDPWSAALHARLDGQADAAARTLHARTLLPAPPARVWAAPLLLLALGAGAWGLPAPVRPDQGPEAARMIEEPPTPPIPTGAGPTPAAPADAAVSPVPTTKPDENPGADTGARTDAAPDPGTRSDAPTGLGTIGRATAVPGRAPTLPRLTEARQGVTPAAHAPREPTPAAPGTRTQDTPFGSRENGQFENQSVTDPDRLAAAPYDPTTAPGARAQQQKTDPGSSGLRAASGGRGIESDGADRCVQGCLTNNDMNRGAAPDPARPKNPQGQTTSGTSDSGGAGTAGSSSGTGLGRGTLRPLNTRVQGELGGAAGAGGRVQVLAAPDDRSAAAPAATSAGAASRWTPGPDLAPPDLPAPTAIPPGAQDAVRAYFDRSSP
ncbi:hypothetical protein [Deinococcus sp. RM]|uniref:hypothetical protein n=1 Tax=Deinococcus sp. RM TaxID=2316359 RepID=UPI003AB69154